LPKVMDANEFRRDRSAVARLIQDFGLLLLSDSFERYLDDQAMYRQAAREGRQADFKSRQDKHLDRFWPLLRCLGIPIDTPNEIFAHYEILEC